MGNLLGYSVEDGLIQKTLHVLFMICLVCEVSVIVKGGSVWTYAHPIPNENEIATNIAYMCMAEQYYRLSDISHIYRYCNFC